MTRDRLLGGLLVYCAIMGAIVLYRRTRSPEPGRSSFVEMADTTGVAGRRFLTPSDRPYSLTVFTDYQCPSCRRFEQTLGSLPQAFRDSISVSVRHLPLESIHPFALAASVAAECARAQDRFAAMHEALFEGQATIGQRAFRAFAERARVPDLAAFDRCMTSGPREQALIADREVAQQHGFTATPTLVIGTLSVSGSPSRGLLDSLLRARGKR